MLAASLYSTTGCNGHAAGGRAAGGQAGGRGVGCGGRMVLKSRLSRLGASSGLRVRCAAVPVVLCSDLMGPIMCRGL